MLFAAKTAYTAHQQYNDYKLPVQSDLFINERFCILFKNRHDNLSEKPHHPRPSRMSTEQVYLSRRHCPPVIPTEERPVLPYINFLWMYKNRQSPIDAR